MRLARSLARGRPLTTRNNPVRALPTGKKGRLVIGVMGSAAPEKTINKELKSRLWTLGKTIGKQGHVLLTGACPGMPQLTARAAKRAGGYTVGISPARSLTGHVKRFHSPTRSLDVIQMTGAGAGMGFIAREKQNIQYSDILVFTGGRSGTLGEILFAMQEPKVIALLEDSTGVTSKTRKQILPIIGKGKGVVVSDRDPVKLMKKALAAHEKLASKQPSNGSLLKRLDRSLARTDAPARNRWPRQQMVRKAPLDGLSRDHTVFSFFGTTRGMTDRGRADVMKLVKKIAGDRSGGRRPLLVTPTRRGLSHVVTRAAHDLGVRTVGISAAGTKKEHRRHRKPRAGYDTIHLTGEGAGVGELAAYQHGIKKSDVVFIAGGDHKTLGGAVFAMYQPTVVAVLENKGMSGKLRSKILSTFDKPAHARMIFDSNPVRLYNKAVKAAEEMRRSAKTEYIAPE